MRFYIPTSFVLLGGVSLANGKGHVPKRLLRGQAEVARKQIIKGARRVLDDREILEPPKAENDTFLTETNMPVVIDVLANDSDPSGLSFAIVSRTDPSNGRVRQVSADGKFEYTPNPDFIGLDSFTYTIRDDEGVGNTAIVTMSVQPSKAADDSAPANVATLNGSPGERFTLTGSKLIGATFTVAREDSVPFHILVKGSSEGILEDNTIDLGDANAANFDILRGPSAGKVKITSNGILFEPPIDYIGTESIKYQTLDTNGDVSKQVTVDLVFGTSNTGGTALGAGLRDAKLNVVCDSLAQIELWLGDLDGALQRDNMILLGTGNLEVEPKKYPVIGSLGITDYGMVYQVNEAQFYLPDQFVYQTLDDFGEVITTVTVLLYPSKEAALTDEMTPGRGLDGLNKDSFVFTGSEIAAKVSLERADTEEFDLFFKSSGDSGSDDTIFVGDPNTKTFELDSMPTSVAVQPTPDGLRVTPPTGFSGEDSLVVRTQDDQGNKSLLTIDITFDASNTSNGMKEGMLDLEQTDSSPLEIFLYSGSGTCGANCIVTGDGSTVDADIIQGPADGTVEKTETGLRLIPFDCFKGNNHIAFVTKNDADEVTNEVELNLATLGNGAGCGENAGGSSGNDTIFGSAGNDTLIGGSGQDIVAGPAGGDAGGGGGSN